MSIVQKKCVAFIPVRGGSKSIPGKNIHNLAGKPLVCWVIDAATAADCIETVYVATDSREIEDVINEYYKSSNRKLKIINRSSHTATDKATSESALIEFCENYDFETVFFIQATSPLLSGNDIQMSWDKYSNGGFDSMLSVVNQKRFLWRQDSNTAVPVNYDPQKRPRRQDFSGHLVENGAFYISSRKLILSSGCRISGTTGIFEMDEKAYFEIDEPVDLVIVEQLLMHQRKRTASGFTCKLLAMDCDGVLTDGCMYYTENGDYMKKFNTRDGMGTGLLHASGIKTAIITGEISESVQKRAEKLNISYLHMGAKNKLALIKNICEKEKISLDEVAYIGDDINDCELLQATGLAACPADAHERIKVLPNVTVLSSRGGNGAVRELIDMILAEKSDE